jgi:hypothetical protein
MVNLLKGRKDLEKAPAFPRFTTQDDARAKFKKLVRYYNKVLEIGAVDLENVIEGLEGDYHRYLNKPENYSGYKCYKLSEIPGNTYCNVVNVLESRAKIEEFEFASVKVLMDKEQDQVFAIIPKLAFSKESGFYGMHKKTGYHFVGINSVGYVILKSKIAELKREKGCDFESAVNHIIFTEHNFVLNQKHSRQSSSTIATFRTDKKYQDTKLNKETIFNQLGFRKVEVDTQKYDGQEFDYNQFKTVEADFEQICNKLPHALAHPELKFRKLGKHKATGLYDPILNIIAVDVRDTTSFIHEYGHYLDYNHGTNGEYSLSEEFEFIISSYKNNFNLFFTKKEEELRNTLMALGKERNGYELISIKEKLKAEELDNLRAAKKLIDYYTTPTEIFARGFELWVFETITSDSKLLNLRDVYNNQIEYASFKGLKESLFSFFNNIFPSEQIQTNCFVASKKLVVKKREWTTVGPTNFGEQMSLF